MGAACCTKEGDVAAEKQADLKSAQDDVKAVDDTPMQVAQKTSGDEAAGPGKVAAPKAAKPSGNRKASKEANEKAKQLAQDIAGKLKEGEGAFSKSDWDGAITAYSQVIELNEKDSHGWAGRGGARLRGGHADEALSDLDQALSLEPENLFALRDRAEARMKTGDLDGAADDFNKKLSLAPGDGRALCGRGEVKLKKGDKEGALEDFQLAMRLSYPGADKLFKEAKAK